MNMWNDCIKVGITFSSGTQIFPTLVIYVRMCVCKLQHVLCHQVGEKNSQFYNTGDMCNNRLQFSVIDKILNNLKCNILNK